MRHPYKRGAAAFLAVLAAAGNIFAAPQAAFGAGAKAGVEESVYINLDYYGTPTKVNVVKAISSNGKTEFTDYGDYQKVTNMSDATEPELADGSVTWKLSGAPGERFYYEAAMDVEKTERPWTFDVSYKLNGVPADGDTLAGASGLVEIHILAEPNDKADEYYRNNMVLLAAVPVDRTSCYSVEAEGSQTQNIGENTFVVFTALPGEEGDFTVRVGTDCFETIGVVMAMAPGTVKDLEHVKDLKEAKDTWKEAGDELYDSMDQMAASMEAMGDGVNQLISGLQSAEAARKTWSGAKDGILAENDQALAAFSAVAGQMEVMIPHIQTAKDSAEVVHESMGGIVDILGDMQDPLRRLNTGLRRIRGDAEDISDELPGLTSLMEQLITLDAALEASTQAYVTGLGSLSGSLGQISEDYYMDAEIATPSDAPAAIPGVTMDGNELLQALMARKGYLEKISASSKSLTSDLSHLMEATGDSARYTAELMDGMDMVIEDLTALNDSLDMYYPDLQAALDDTRVLTEQTADALKASVDALSALQNTVRASSDDFDAAARDTIYGSMELLDKSLGLLDSTSSMRAAGRTMKDTLDEEWEDLEDDTLFLNMDPNAPKVSFTSPENAEPDTLQIILRTEEISLDDDEEVLDAETEPADVSPLQRMWNVLVKMWNAIVEIFKNR